MSLSYRWLIVAVGALMTCVALGAMFSLAVFMEQLGRVTGLGGYGRRAHDNLAVRALADLHL